ncbi:MAG: ATP-binding protein [Candidatus Bathyarchaeia archaeon]|jgi:signal transduction histidine kinase
MAGYPQLLCQSVLKLTVSAEANNQGQAVVTVEDTGVGISEKIKTQIFTP